MQLQEQIKLRDSCLKIIIDEDDSDDEDDEGVEQDPNVFKRYELLLYFIFGSMTVKEI